MLTLSISCNDRMKMDHQSVCDKNKQNKTSNFEYGTDSKPGEEKVMSKLLKSP